MSGPLSFHTRHAHAVSVTRERAMGVQTSTGRYWFHGEDHANARVAQSSHGRTTDRSAVQPSQEHHRRWVPSPAEVSRTFQYRPGRQDRKTLATSGIVAALSRRAAAIDPV